VTVTASYTHRDENTDTYSGPTIWHQDVVGFGARNDRKSGSTEATYTYDQFSNSAVGSETSGIDHTLTLSDSETMGSREQIRLGTGASYTRRDDSSLPSDEFTATASLTAEHHDNLTSYYDFGFDRYTTGTFESENYLGQAQLKHHLYDSLDSTLIARGNDYENSDSFNDGYTRRYGLGFNEAYTKHLSETVRLRVDGSLMGEHVDQQNIGTAVNEAHSFATAGAGVPNSFFLNLPNVDQSTIKVWNVGRTQLYVEGIHYTVFQNGDLTAIQAILTSGIDLNVVVDYSAQPTPAGHYETLTDSAGVRFEFWNNHWGIFARYSSFINDAPKELNVPDLNLYQVGTDFLWRRLRAGVDYTYYDSSLSSYKTARAFENLASNLDQDSSISLDLSQMWTRYIDAHREETDYRFLTHYHRRLTPRLRLDAEGGFDLRSGEGADQTLATVRLGIDYAVGKTTFKAGYDYEYSLFLNNEERNNHRFVVSVKRIL
jgi:hypothetical protein